MKRLTDRATTLLADGEAIAMKAYGLEIRGEEDEATKQGLIAVVKLSVAAVSALVSIAESLDYIADHMPAAPR